MSQPIIIEELHVDQVARYTLHCDHIQKSSNQTEKEFSRTFHRLAPGAIFVYERWNATGWGTQSWTITVGRASLINAVKRVGIFPACEILVTASGKSRVGKAKQMIAESIAHFGCLDYVPIAHWIKLDNVLPMRSVKSLFLPTQSWCKAGSLSAESIEELPVFTYKTNDKIKCKHCGRKLTVSSTPGGKIMIPRHKHYD